MSAEQGHETGRPALGDLRGWARREPDRPAVILDGEVTTFGHLEAAANRLARLLAARGLVRGDHVAAIVPNGPFGFVLAWAASRAGVYYTPVSTSLSARDAAVVVADCEARILFVDGEYAEVGQGIGALLPASVARLSVGAPLPGFTPAEPELAAQSDAPRADESHGALMLYTSGTTGAPKGVFRPLPPAGHQGPPTFVGAVPAIFGFDEHTRYLSPAPIYHAAPLRFSLAAQACGGTVVLMRRFDALRALRLLREHEITHSQWVPTMFQRMLALPESERRAFSAPSHRVAIHAAAPCPVPVKRAMIDWWGPIVVEYYGGSEGVGMTAIDTPQWLERPGSVGRARLGVIHVVDEAFNELPVGAVGNVYFSGAPRFEYFKAPEKTATRTSPQGWQTLGDIGRVDEAGYLFLTDRQDDMIISGGVNVYPQEIEAALMERSEVMDCGVVGMPHVDFGECAVAFVVLTPVVRDNAAATVDALDDYCRERLGRIKRPARIVVVDEVPRTPMGKLLRRELRKNVSAKGEKH